jgi:hypothetical protein
VFLELLRHSVSALPGKGLKDVFLCQMSCGLSGVFGIKKMVLNVSVGK